MLTHQIVGRKRLSEPSPFGHWDRCLSAPLTGRHPTSDRPTPARRRSANPGFGTVASSRRRGSHPPTVTRACENRRRTVLGLQHGVVQIPFAPRLPVRTARLMLRQLHAEDLEPLLGFHSDADAVRYVPYPQRDRQTMRTVLERKIANTRLAHDDDLLKLAVVRTDDQVLIGDVLLVLRSVEHQRWKLAISSLRPTADRGTRPRRYVRCSRSPSLSWALGVSWRASMPGTPPPGPCSNGSVCVKWQARWITPYLPESG